MPLPRVGPGNTGTLVQPGRAERGGAGTGNVSQGSYDPLRQMPRLRADPKAPETAIDGTVIARFQMDYDVQTQNLLVRDRQIEYNVRMLVGQQWNQWHPTLGRFFDVADWLTDAEKTWRRMPVINKLLRYFMVTHSRLTEGQPILTMLPGPDRIDAELAQTLDTLFKKDWRDAGMEDVHDELMMWLIVAGRAFAISRIDLTAGEWMPWVAESHVQLAGPDGLPIPGPDGQPQMTPAPVPNVPLGPDGQPRAMMGLDGQLTQLQKPHFERMGAIGVDVYSPLQVRGQWGPQPWHRKRWHAVQRFLTPDQVYQAWQIEVEPDMTATAAANIATLERVLYGSGFYGQSLGRAGTGWSDSRVKGPLCTVYERWESPLPFQEELVGTWAETLMESPENPGGRHTIWTPNRLIRDGAREEAWRYTSPIRCFDFLRLAGRPSGMTPLEAMLGPQRGYNRARGQVEEQAALLGNPQIIADEGFGLQAHEFDNDPGHVYIGNKRPGVAPVEYLAVPSVSQDVVRSIEYAAGELEEIGGLRGLEGAAPSRNASGNLVEELRFNADRILGSTARRLPAEYARMAADWQLLYRRIYTAKTIIAINGDDFVAETLSVLPEVFKEGHINIMPDAESMLPEGRGERQARAEKLYMAGVFGDPQSVEARDTFLSLSRFPNYARMARPGGIDRETAEAENGKILMGELEQPVLEWYDHMAHLAVHERYMKSVQFLKQSPVVQQGFYIHRMLHLMRLQAIMAPPGLAPGMGGPPGVPGGGLPSGLPGGMPGGGDGVVAGGPPGGGNANVQTPPAPALAPGAARLPASVARQGGRAPTAMTGPQG